jgi:hypothetical protein
VIYQLVLITNLGIMTPLISFEDWDSCVREKTKISKTQQYSVECLPAQSPVHAKEQIESSMNMMMDILNKFSLKSHPNN